jgi:hypothetical protein
MKISVVALKQLIRESLKEMGMKEMSVEELERKLEDIHAEPDMMDDDYSDEEASELKRMQEPEEGEEHPKHLGMGHHLHETIKLMVSEVLEEAKAKKYKGKSMRKGGGDRFAKLDDKLKASGKKRAAKK